jgi:hypothetical protein
VPLRRDNLKLLFTKSLKRSENGHEVSDLFVRGKCLFHYWENRRGGVEGIRARTNLASIDGTNPGVAILSTLSWRPTVPRRWLHVSVPRDF